MKRCLIKASASSSSRSISSDDPSRPALNASHPGTADMGLMLTPYRLRTSFSAASPPAENYISLAIKLLRSEKAVDYPSFEKGEGKGSLAE
jgi:hypothetical protein